MTSLFVPIRLRSLGQIVPLTGAPAKAGTKAIYPRSLRLQEKPRFAGPPLPGEASSEAEALQLRGVADYRSSAQRVGALCIAGLTRRMASHVLHCSCELMRSATELSEDSKGTRTFLWPWVQHLAAQATAACGGSREPEQGQRSKFSSAARGATKILGTATR
jgi:hypothetical protein